MLNKKRQLESLNKVIVKSLSIFEKIVSNIERANKQLANLINKTDSEIDELILFNNEAKNQIKNNEATAQKLKDFFNLKQ